MSVLTNIESEQAEPAESNLGPGTWLRKERQAQGLDQSRAAAQLHLKESMIEALEKDDFDVLPGPVFTQGYLRNYARLLGIPESEIMSAYHRICPQSDHGGLKAKSSSGVVKEVRSSHRLVQLTTWLIAIGLLALLVIWWQDRMDWQDEPVAEVQQKMGADVLVDPQPMDDAAFLEQIPSITPAATPTEYLPVEEEPLEAEPDSLVLITPADQTEISPTKPLPEPIESSAEAESAPTTKLDTPQEEVEAPDIATTELQQVSQVIEATPVEEVVPEVQSTPAPSGQLVFEFSDRCWAEVRDSTGKAHIIEEMQAGTRRTLASNLGPFKIVLGNVKAVRLSVDGKPFDLTTHARGVVARFDLDPKNP